MKKTKRAVSLLLVLAMIVAMFTVGLTQTGAAGYDGPPILGDVDGDGSVTLLDALNLQLSLVDRQGYISTAEYNSMPHTQKEFRVANCYKDEVIDLIDVLWIQLYRVDNKAAIDAGIGKPLDELPTEPTQPATVKPTETQAPTTKPVGTATVTLKNNGVEYETKTFNVGDTFTVYTILNTSSIDSGKISTAAGEQYYTKELLARVDALDDENLIEDTETVFPILSQGNALGNGMDEGILYFSGSNASKKKPYVFNTDSSKLLVTQYTVTAAGKATVETNLKTLAQIDDYLTKIVDKYVTQDGYSFTYFSTFTDNGVAPTTKPTETQAPTTKPTETQAPTTKPTETQAPTAKPTETQAPTTKPTETQAPTTPPEPVKGFYIVGSMNDNTINLDYLITEQDESGSYVFKGLQLKTTDQFKVAYSDNGKTISRPYYWYPSGSGNSYGLNGEIKADGTYNVYFRPKADGGDDWFHGVLYVVDASAPTAKPTETQAPTVKPTEAPTPVKGFYIVGSMTDMKINSDYLLTEKDEAGSYVFKGLQLKTTDYFKVAYTDNGKTVSRPYYWYPSGNGNNYGENGEIKADSTYNVYFRPTADGGEDWFHGVIYVEDTVTPTAKPTETQAATTAPSGKATVTLVNNGVQYESKTFNVGDIFTVYTILNTAGINSGKISTVAGSQKYTSSVLAINDALDEEDLIEDTDTVFPILSEANVIGNAQETGILHFSGSNASKTKPYVFNSNTSKLAVTSYKVTAAGDATVETNIKTLALTDDYLTKIVDKYVTQDGYSFTFFSTFTDNGTAPTSAETTAPTIKPTETQAPTTKPTETQAPTTAPEGKATVTLVNSGVQYESKTFNVGDTFTVYTILNTSSIDSGKISTVAGDQNYTSSILTLTDAIDSEGLIDDVDKVFPILSEAIVIGNSNETGILHFTGSNASKTKPYIFNADTCKLAVTNYKVTAPGNATVETNIKTLTQIDDYLTRIVDKYVTQSGYSFTFFSTFTDNGTAPTSSGTTAPTVKPTETQAPTTIPTETQAPETQTPTTSENNVTLYFSNNKGWNSVNVYMWSENGGESTAWPGVAPTYVGTNDYGESIYSVTVNTDQYDKVIFNGTGGQTEDVDVATAVSKGSGLYCLDEQNDLGHYLVGYYEYVEIPTTAPETQKPSTSDGEDVTLYFSNNKGWSSVNVYMWSDNGESTAWPGVAATYVKDNDYGEGIYSVTLNTAQYDKVIFNGSGGQTEDVDVAAAVAQGNGIYCLDEQNDLGHYKVGFYEYTGTAQPTQAQETQAPATQAPATQAPTTKPTTVTGEDVTLYFSNNKGWDSVNVYMWSDGGESTAWPGVAATYVGNNDYGEGIYSVTLNTAQYDSVIFNGSGGQTEDVDVAAAKAQGSGLYCLDEQNDLGHYKVGYYEYTGTAQPTQAQDTQAPATQAPTTKPTTVTGEDVTLYFSNNKNWSSVNVYMWSENGGESTAWPGVAATYVGNNDYGEGIYSVTLNTAQYDKVIFNGSGGQTEDVDVAAAKAQGSGLYCLDEQNELGHYKVGFYEYTGTTQPTTAPETQAPATQAPTTKPTTVTGEDVTLYFSNNKGWDSVNVYMWSDGGESTEWPGVAATYVGTNNYGEGIYSVTLNTAQYDFVIFNDGANSQTVDISVAEAYSNGLGMYCKDTQNELGHYEIAYYEYDGTTKPTQAQETQAPTTKPTTVTGEDVTLYFSNNKNWSSVNVYMWSDGGESTAWPGVEATYVGKNAYEEDIYSVTVNTAQYDMVIFNGSGGQTEDVDVASAAAQGCGLYCKDTQNGLGHYEVGYYDYSDAGEPQQPTSAPETQAPATESTTVSFLLTDNFNWGKAYVYAWDENGNALNGEWPGASQAETITNDYGERQFKCVVPAGATGVILNNGSGAQTEDITDFTYTGYWMDGTKNNLGHYKVIGWK